MSSDVSAVRINRLQKNANNESILEPPFSYAHNIEAGSCKKQIFWDEVPFFGISQKQAVYPANFCLGRMVMP